jgi:hypothetical protein
MPTLERLKEVGGLGFAPPQKIVFQKDAKWCILLHFGYKICSVKSLNIVALSLSRVGMYGGGRRNILIKILWISFISWNIIVVQK